MTISTINQPKLLYYAAIGWTVAIFIGCSIPGDGVPQAFTSRDKLTHIAIFLLFGLLWRWLGRSVWWVVLAGIVYGMLIEIWQGIMPINRSFDLYDSLADTVGTLLGIGLVWVGKRVSQLVSYAVRQSVS